MVQYALTCIQIMPNQKIGIWFTQGFANLYHALHDIRDADVGKKYSLICSHPNAQFVGFEAADVALVEPEGKEEFMRFVLEVIKQYSVKVIVPSRRQAWFNKHKTKFARMGVTVLTVAESSMLHKIDNKAHLYRHLSGTGLVNIPLFETFKTCQDFDAAHARLSRKVKTLCVKPDRGVYGSGFRVLKKGKGSMLDLLNESLKLGVEDLRHRLSKDGSHTMLLMEYLDGAERSVDCLASNGELLVGVVRRKSTSSVEAQVVEYYPDLLEQVAQLTRHLKLNGLFNVQFKDLHGEPYLLEINTRLSGRSYYATVAGANLPYLMAEHFGAKVPMQKLDFDVDYGLRIGNVNSPVIIHTAYRELADNCLYSFESE